MLWAGGVWDRLERRFTDADPTEPHIVELEPSQVEFVSWFATWLRDFREGYPRDISLILNAGGRRGGKTFSAVLCQIAALIDVPIVGQQRTIGWIVSENYKKRNEIEEQISAYFPRRWYTHRKAPEYTYTFENGALLRNLSADDPEDMRQGKVDVLVYNEPQTMNAKAVVNGLFGTADRGGLTILAANPPTAAKGEWTIDLKEAIDSNEIAGARYFNFDPKLNRRIEQATRSRVANIARVINPSQMMADDEGTWARLGDLAYPRFRKALLGCVPDDGAAGFLDVTAEVLFKKFGKPFPYLGGVDFQGYPFNAGVLFRIFRSELIRGLIYWAVDEFQIEGSEIDFLDDVRERGYGERDIGWIGDASGQWQDGKHDFGRGMRSFAEFKKDGWLIRPPREKKTEKATYSSNPPVESRLRVMMRIMDEERYRIDPVRCPDLAKAVKECPIRKSGTRIYKHGRFAHITDGADYPLYWCDPKPEKPRKPLDPSRLLDRSGVRASPL